MLSAKITAMIPARAGSERLKLKNLCMLGDEPVIGHVIKAAKESGAFNRIVVNSEHPGFAEIAERYGVDFYNRPAELGSSSAKSDQFIADFIENNPCEFVAIVNPPSPLQPPAEIRAVVAYFFENNLDSLITSNTAYFHTRIGGKPVNFSYDEIFSKTQDLVPAELLVYSLMIWRCKTFLEKFKRDGHAMFVGKFGTYPVSKESAVAIKTTEDLQLAAAILKAKAGGPKALEYDPLVEKILSVKG